MNQIKQIFWNGILAFSLVSLFACQANKEIVSVEEQRKPETLEIAILMPLSKEQPALGSQYNQLIKMGLEDGLKTNIHVTSYDISDEQQAIVAMDKVVARNTKIILGPLYSNLTSSIAKVAEENDIIVITMSNNPAIADRRIFVFGHAPFKQVARLINYFADNDYKHFISLLPSGKHSQTVKQLVQDMMIRKNATLVRSEFYSNVPESIDQAVLNASNIVDNLNEMEDILAKPVIYLSDDTKNLNLIFNNIHKYYLDKKAVIIGDNRIDIYYPKPINIIFTGSVNILNSNVVERAKDIGINHFSFMHAMAYDLGKMTSKYIDTQFTVERFLGFLNGKSSYAGISGNIHFTDSIAQRGYDIIKKEDGVYSVVDLD